MRFLTALPLVLIVAARLAAGDALEDYATAMAGDDFQAKRAAIQAVASLPKDQDEKVLGLLVQAVGDRQSTEVALAALRARTGLQKPGGWVKRGSGYPNYPTTDDAAGWGAWLSGWKKDNDEKKKLSDVEKKAKELEKKAKELEKKKDKKEGEADPAAAAGDQAKPEDKPRIAEVAVEKGPRCRIHFKSGGSKVYYLLAKRTDADGNLLSVRVSYMDGGGTEVLTADAIARIDEDVK